MSHYPLGDNLDVMKLQIQKGAGSVASVPIEGRKILLLDDDPWILRMVGTVLERRGHEVQTASDGVEGLEKTARYRPDLIIADVMMPRMNGWSFVRSLRSHHNKRMSMVPVIFLTGLSSEEDRILGFRLGADDYLPKPFRFEELDLRVEQALRTSRLLREQVQEQVATLDGLVLEAEEEETPPARRVSLSGSLEQLGVHAVLTIMEMESKSGVLVLVGAGKAKGRIFLRQGRPVGALLEGVTELTDADAVFAMLYWRRGSFEFSVAEVDMEDQINMSVTHLLMEGARLMDEAGLD